MTLHEFISSLQKDQPPTPLPRVLEALWWDARDNWKKAHELIQHDLDNSSSWVHAYLHRKEGDLGNAAYWYAKSGRPLPAITLEEEWAQMVEYFLEN